MNALDVSSMCTAMAAALEAGIGRQIGYFCKEEGDSVQLCSNKPTAAQLKDGWLPKVLPQDTLWRNRASILFRSTLYFCEL